MLQRTLNGLQIALVWLYYQDTIVNIVNIANIVKTVNIVIIVNIFNIANIVNNVNIANKAGIILVYRDRLPTWQMERFAITARFIIHPRTLLHRNDV